MDYKEKHKTSANRKAELRLIMADFAHSSLFFTAGHDNPGGRQSMMVPRQTIDVKTGQDQSRGALRMRGKNLAYMGECPASLEHHGSGLGRFLSGLPWVPSYSVCLFNLQGPASFQLPRICFRQNDSKTLFILSEIAISLLRKNLYTLYQ